MRLFPLKKISHKITIFFIGVLGCMLLLFLVTILGGCCIRK